MFKDRLGFGPKDKKPADKKVAEKGKEKGAATSNNNKSTTQEVDKGSLLWGINALNEKNFEAGLNFVKKVCAFLEDNKGTFFCHFT